MIKLKNNRGVTLIALTITILIMTIITGTLVYNSYKGISSRTLTNMYNDIELLKDKVATYYVQYGKLPILQEEYPYISNIKNINANDNNKYYVIDLSLLSNLTLNYGEGYKKVKENNVFNSDVYVINEQSHNIYYPIGIKYDDVVYYTIKENYSDVKINSYDRPYIPEGFAYKEGSWNTGFVIREIETDNEFVWIPVKDYDEFVADAEYKVAGYSDIENGYTISQEHYENMLKSVKDNGGFYIGRYEAGIKEARLVEGNIESNNVSIQNVYPYNFVTRLQAQRLSEKLVVKDRTASLMYGIQWDAVLRFISQYENSYKLTMSAGGSAEWGNYSNSTFSFYNMARVKYTTDGKTWQIPTTNKNSSFKWGLTTGASAQNKVLNIYDFAGNMSEYTLENSNISNKNVTRGGNCSSTGTTAAETRVEVANENSTFDVGFRIAIW